VFARNEGIVFNAFKMQVASSTAIDLYKKVDVSRLVT
jgi:hypothetical protein